MFLPWWEWSLLDSIFRVQRSQNCLMNMKLTNDQIIKWLNTPGRLRASVLDRPHPRSSKKPNEGNFFFGRMEFHPSVAFKRVDAKMRWSSSCGTWFPDTLLLRHFMWFFLWFVSVNLCETLDPLCHIALLNILQHLDFHTVINCLNQGLGKDLLQLAKPWNIIHLEFWLC